VRKDVVPNDASQWTITLTSPNNQGEHADHPVLGDGGAYTFAGLGSGTYTVTESGPDGYLSSVTCATCAGSGRSASFTVDDQTVVEVLFTNTRQQSGSGGGSGGGSSGGTTAFSAPTPTAGPDQNACVGERVCLSAQAVDPEQGSEGLRYQWSFFVRYYNYGIPVFEFPAGSRVLDTIEGFNTAAPCFTPDMAGDYVLVVTVTDRDGMWSMDAVKIHAEPCGEVFSCSYDEGWNLLSLLGQPLNPNAEDILAGTSAQGPALAYENGGYVEAYTLSPIEGFWVHFFTPDSLDVIGREIRNDVTITLEQPGWHLISSPFAIDWERVLVFVNGAERFVVESVARDLIADFCACYDPEASVYRVSEEVLPCQGYWVRTYQPNVVLKLRWGALNFAAQPNLSGCEGETTDNVPAPPSTQTAGNGRASVLAYPNPVRHSVVHFEIAGERVAARIQVSVFALSGELVWQGESSENAMDWEPRAPSGERLPWGPYIYCVSRSQGGDWLRVGCGILFIAEVDG
jgi:hypothetical protein